jgi:small nuclear ribonucleoprotein (snRNP)-like protein
MAVIIAETAPKVRCNRQKQREEESLDIHTMSKDAFDGKKTGVGGGFASSQRKDSSIELQKLMDSMVLVKCIGGRELKGILRGFDDLVNLVLDDSEEYIRGKLENYQAVRWFSRTK